MLPTEPVGSPSLEMLRSCVDVVLGRWLWMALLEQGVGPEALQRALPSSATSAKADGCLSGATAPGLCALPWGRRNQVASGGGDQSAVGAQLVSSERAEGGKSELLETPGIVCLFYHFCWCFSGRLAFGGSGGEGKTGSFRNTHQNWTNSLKMVRLK